MVPTIKARGVRADDLTMAKDKGAKTKRAKTLGPATIAKPALIGAAILALVNVALKG